MNWLFDYFLLIGAIFLPALVFALAMHGLEHLTQRHLARRFGWRSVLWTGWLGTPIHEFSHVLTCWLFRHRVEEVRLFDPDEKEGRLGFVRHSYRRGNLYEEIGNVFIGTSPLLFGSVVLVGLTYLFYPEVIRLILEKSGQLDLSQLGEAIPNTLALIWNALQELAKPEHLVQPRFWAFCYLILCVGSHTAPSRSDYRGAGRGAILLLGLLAVASLTISLFGGTPVQLGLTMVQLLSPLWAVAALALAACSLSAILVVAICSIV